jgi:hypothetical protein
MQFSTMLPFREGRAAFSPGPASAPGGPPSSWGYIDQDGKVAIAPQYDRVSVFSEGLAAVARGGKSGFIDATGTVVIPLEFERAHPFVNGRAGVQINRKWGFIDRAGKVVITPQFHFVWAYAEGMARIDASGDKCGYIDENGKVIVKPQFEDAEPFTSGIAAVQTKRKWGFIDRTGKFVIPAQYDNANSVTSDGLALVEQGRKTVRVPATPTLDRLETSRGLFGFIDKSGGIVIPLRFAGAHDFSSGLAPVNFASV